MNEHATLIMFILISIGIGGYAGVVTYQWSFGASVPTKGHGIKVLQTEQVDKWNALRLRYVKWRPNLDGVKFVELRLEGCDFRFCSLKGASFAAATLDNSVFDNATLVSCDFARASLLNVSFDGANLQGARLTGANLRGAVFHKADVSGTKFPDNFTFEHEEIEAESRVSSPGDLLARDTDSLSPAELENLVSDILAGEGYKVELPLTARDSGYDMKLVKSDPVIGDQTILVEVKKYLPDQRVAPASVSGLLEAMTRHKATGAMLITTGEFSKVASAFASNFPGLRLVDRTELAKMVNRYRNRIAHGYSQVIISDRRVWDVFLSYSSRDKECAGRVLATLKRHGIRVFDPFVQLASGDVFSKRIMSAIRESREVAILVSRDSDKSEWVMFEWAAASALGLRVTPILCGVGPDMMPSRLRELQAVRIEEISDYAQDLVSRKSLYASHV